MLAEQLPGVGKPGFRRRAEDSIVADFDRAAGKHVLEEARDEFDSRQSDTASFLRAVIAVAESDYTVVDGFKPAVGDGDPEDVAPEVVEHLIAASGVLGMNDPVFFPHR